MGDRLGADVDAGDDAGPDQVGRQGGEEAAGLLVVAGDAVAHAARREGVGVAGDGVRLRDVEDVRQPKRDAGLLLFAAVLGRYRAAEGAGGEDGDTPLPFADAAAELEPAAEAGDVGRLGRLAEDQQGVVEAVAVELGERGGIGAPALGRGERLDGGGERVVGGGELSGAGLGGALGGHG